MSLNQLGCELGKKNLLGLVTLLGIASILFAAPQDPTPKESIKQGSLVEPTHGPIVVLADGGVLVARPVGITPVDVKKPGSARSLLLDSEVFGKVQLSTDAVAGILFDCPPGVEARDESIVKLFGFSQARRLTDGVTLVNGDQLEGPLLAIENRQITVETPFGRTGLKVDQVASITFGGKSSKLEEENTAKTKTVTRTLPQFFTGWSDGSRFPVVKLVKTQNHRLQVWPYDVAQSPWIAQPDRLRFRQSLSQKELVYLSDLEPSEYRHTPFLDHQLPLGKDRNVLGLPLRVGGTLYPKGLGMASRSTVVYTLDGHFSRFEASLAIDDSTDGGGSVVFRVLLDGKPIYTSPTIRGGQKPIPISIDTTDAKQLELEVDYADQADQLDRADWLDARVEKRGPWTEDRGQKVLSHQGVVEISLQKQHTSSTLFPKPYLCDSRGSDPRRSFYQENS